ncbi:MAG: N-acetyl-gamma-glutamyl-phosphate reductase [Acidimicrobiales bacterium]|jgi:N-acetyl-gamma-glutamyl-phosphate reductase|nr:N-acetyl-gamma-glutamyl-phosphate reductase [Acidimicrobiales bacterium]
MVEVGIVGASGYTGAELLRLCAGHPDLHVRWATGDTQAGVAAAELYPSLTAAYPDLRFSPYDEAALADVDLVFSALPHGASQALMPTLRREVRWVVDLAADFRLQDPALYPHWYGEPHAAPALLADFAYGLPELFRADIAAATAVATPGCYPTAAALAVAPLVAEGLVELDTIVVDAVSGLSGAGRPPKEHNTFCAADEDVTAYGLLTHRHTPEIEQSVARIAGVGADEVSALFTPHLVPMSRGMLATCYLRPRAGTGDGGDLTTDGLLELYRAAYADEPFVVVTAGSPSTKACTGSNTAHVTVRADPRTGWIVALAAIDNLTKGASGQALQCANILAGLPEGTGLSGVGVYP